MRASVNKMVGVLNRFGSSLNTNTRQRILQAFVIPKVTFCLPVWGHVENKQCAAMDHVLQRAARVVLHDKTASLNRQTYDVTGLVSFALMTEWRCDIAVSALLSRENTDSCLPPLLAAGSQCSGRTTRSVAGRCFLIPKHALTASQKCFFYAATKHWNNLPAKLTAIQCHKLFTTQLRNHFITLLA